MSRIRTLGVLALLLGLTAGCGATQTYTGERRPREQVAYVKGRTFKWQLFYQLDINVVAVDGVERAGAKFDFEVLPGEHTLSIAVGWSTHLLAAPLVALKGLKVTPSQLTFRAEAGRTYKLNGEEGPDKLFFVWLGDEVSGAIVAGKRPGPAASPE